MEKLLPFTGILSNKPEENPDFFNWNRVKLRYCDGASFSGDGQNEASQLYFRGQKIWLAAMEELMALGMKNANQALLSGCSAGGLAAILHCDKFRNLFPSRTKVKCLSDAGLFLDAVDVSGGHALRDIFAGVVSLQNVKVNLPGSCISHMNPTSCFFPQNLVANVKTPLFLLNAAYDAWQLQSSLAPSSADPRGSWASCKLNHQHCNSSQIEFLQDFRKQMLGSIKIFSSSPKNGLFINSCFAHCQSERQDTWFAEDSPLIGNKMGTITLFGRDALFLFLFLHLSIIGLMYVWFIGLILVLAYFPWKHGLLKTPYQPPRVTCGWWGRFLSYLPAALCASLDPLVAADRASCCIIVMAALALEKSSTPLTRNLKAGFPPMSSMYIGLNPPAKAAAEPCPGSGN
ncbi:hypothetical protein SAY87_009931 [Trapa incisa]|uniref:Pectin acetylesterase n=1 Tax=Trapa incisa TaxID=236973 RepID=A0AAN7JH62_9MYRT|nr:hypothetical protein SAY87_009931 [Trapa incisa]